MNEMEHASATNPPLPFIHASATSHPARAAYYVFHYVPLPGESDLIAGASAPYCVPHFIQKKERQVFVFDFIWRTSVGLAHSKKENFLISFEKMGFFDFIRLFLIIHFLTLFY